MRDESFYGELKRVKRGVRLAWILDFLMLVVVFDALAIVFFLSMDSSNKDIARFLIVSTVIAVILSATIMTIITAKSSRILLSAASVSLEPAPAQLSNIVAEVSLAAGLSTPPEVYVDRGTSVANAYSVSDSHGNARIVVTAPLERMLNRDEMTAVIAHEVGHITSGDSLSMTKLVALTSMVGLLAGMGFRMMGFGGGRRRNSSSNKVNPLAVVILLVAVLMLIIMPFLSWCIQTFISQQREFHADALSVRYSRNPTALATALLRLEYDDYQPDADDANRFKRVSELAFASPSSLSSTHPSTDSRVKALVQMGARLPTSHPAVDRADQSTIGEMPFPR